MEVKALTNFYLAIAEDNRIAISHIALYMALFQLYNLNQFQNPIEFVRVQIMAMAKISGLATYHKCIRDLADFGYIEYYPSYNPSVRTRVVMKEFLF